MIKAQTFSTYFVLFMKQLLEHCLFFDKISHQEVTKGQSWWGGRVHNQCQAVFSQKLIHRQCGVGRRMVMKEPISSVPKIFFVQILFLNFLWAEFLNDHSSWRNKRLLYNTSTIKHQYCLHMMIFDHLVWFLWMGGKHCLPLAIAALFWGCAHNTMN